MYFTKSFVLLKIFSEIILVCSVQGDHSPLAKICHENSQNVCVGVYVTSQWVLASSLCQHVRYKNTKVIIGSLQRDCITGKTNKISGIYDLRKTQNLSLLKVDAPKTNDDSNFMGKYFGQSSCHSYCFQGTSEACGKRIDPIPTTIISCKDEVGLKDKDCLKTNNGSDINSLNGSPILCNGTMVGFVNLMSTKNLLTLVNLSKFNNEINEIIERHAKDGLPIQNSNHDIGEVEFEIDRPHRRVISHLPQKNKGKGKDKGKGKGKDKNKEKDTGKKRFSIKNIVVKLKNRISKLFQPKSLKGIAGKLIKKAFKAVIDLIMKTAKNAFKVKDDDDDNEDDDDDDDDDRRKKRKMPLDENFRKQRIKPKLKKRTPSLKEVLMRGEDDEDDDMEYSSSKSSNDEGKKRRQNKLKRWSFKDMLRNSVDDELSLKRITRKKKSGADKSKYSKKRKMKKSSSVRNKNADKLEQ